MLATRLWRAFGLQTEGEIADRGAAEAGDNPVVQEYCDAGRIGEFKERECEAASLEEYGSILGNTVQTIF